MVANAKASAKPVRVPKISVAPSRPSLGWISKIISAYSAAATYRQLSALTDAQLAARGLRREDLGREIFRRHFE